MKIYVSDFETTAHENNSTRVWAYATCEVANANNITVGSSIDEFIKRCENDVNSIHYFHNLAFDGEFIISWLLLNGYKHSKNKNDRTFNVTISKMHQFYLIEVIFKQYKKRYKKVVFMDSMKKLPFSVERIAKAFKLAFKKLELDYNAVREIDHVLTDEEIEYIIADVKIVAEALAIQFAQGLNKMTIGADALASFKQSLAKSSNPSQMNKVFRRHFPLLKKEIDDEVRLAYRGGFTYVKEGVENIEIGVGMSFDVNSLYPSVMYYDWLPYGTPQPFYGEYSQNKKYPLYIIKVRAKFKLKEKHIPTIQIKNNLSFLPNKYIKEYTTNNENDEGVILHLTNVDLELFKAHYNILDIEYISGYMFKRCKGAFKDYIDYWAEIKAKSNGAMRELAKLMLNNLYGKFASNPDITGKIPYLDDENIVKYKKDKHDEIEPVYTAMGVFITSYARYKTITTAQSMYDRFLYCDTDSVHITGLNKPKIEIHDTQLGAWKHEYNFSRARYIRAKTYIEDSPKEGLVIRCAGMTDDIKTRVTFDNFKVGFEDTRLRKKTVHGGIKLIETPFRIKEDKSLTK